MITVIIDAHYHLRQPELRWGVQGETPVEAINLMDEKGVDVSVVFVLPSQTHTCSEAAQRDNNFIADSVKKYPKRFVGFCVTSPFLEDNGVKEIERVKQFGLRGIKLHPFYTGRNTLDLLSPILEKASDLKMPVTMHSSEPELDPDRIGFLAHNFPDLTVLMAHMGGGSILINWRFAIEQAKHNKNIVLETSGFYNYPGAIREAVRVIGADRIVYGTDGPYLPVDIPDFRKFLHRAGLSESEKKAVLGENMRRVLNL